MRFHAPRAVCGQRRRPAFAPLALAGVFLTNCASVYLQNRLRDAGDILTIEVNTHAYGASARLGPLKAGAYYKSPDGFSAGLRGGRMGTHHSAEFTGLFFGADYFSELPLDDLLPPQPPAKTDGKTEPKKPTRPTGKKQNLQGSGLLTVQRQKAFRAWSPLGTSAPAHTKRSLLKKTKDVFTVPSYFTQIELSVAAFGGIKIGFNPGELLDFLLGWFTIDLYGDDAPYPDPRLKKLRQNPMFRDLDEKTQQKILKEMEGFQGIP